MRRQDDIECPWCGCRAALAAFRPLRRPPGREQEYAVPLKCPICGWKFAPLDRCQPACYSSE